MLKEMNKGFFTHDDAIKHLKKLYRPGCTYFVCVSTFLYSQIPNEEGKEGRGFEGYAHIAVSQRQALKFVKDIFGNRFREEGCKIRIDDSISEERGGCIFIG